MRFPEHRHRQELLAQVTSTSPLFAFYILDGVVCTVFSALALFLFSVYTQVHVCACLSWDCFSSPNQLENLRAHQ